MSNTPKKPITIKDLSDDKRVRFTLGHEEKRNGSPVWETVRGDRAQMESLTPEIQALQVRIIRHTEQVTQETRGFFNRLLGGKTDAPKPDAHGIPPLGEAFDNDNGVVLWSNTEEGMTSIQKTLEQAVVIGKQIALLRSAKVEDVKVKLYAKRHELGAQVAMRTIEEVRQNAESGTHPELRYRIDKDSIPADLNIAGHKGAEAVRYLLEEEIRIQEVWNRVCALTGTKRTLPAISIGYTKSSLGAAVAAIIDVDYTWEKDSRAHAKSFVAAEADILNFDIEECLKNRGFCEKLIVHELTHMIASKEPNNELISEGTAEAVCYLYAEVFDKPCIDSVGSPNYRTLYGPEKRGFALPDCAVTDGMFHRISGSVGSAMLLQALGETTEERLANLPLLIKVSQPSDKDDAHPVSLIHPDGSHSVKLFSKLPTSEQWLKRLDEVKPGLGESIRVHPSMQPVEPVAMALFLPMDHGNKSGTWGKVVACAFMPNQNFGYTPPLPRHIAPPTAAFDKNAGVTIPLPFAMRITSKNQVFKTMCEGFVSIDPSFLLSLPLKKKRKALRHGVKIEVQTDNAQGPWHTIVENATLTDEEMKTDNEEAEFHLRTLPKEISESTDDADDESGQTVTEGVPWEPIDLVKEIHQKIGEIDPLIDNKETAGGYITNMNRIGEILGETEENTPSDNPLDAIFGSEDFNIGGDADDQDKD